MRCNNYLTGQKMNIYLICLDISFKLTKNVRCHFRVVLRCNDNPSNRVSVMVALINSSIGSCNKLHIIVFFIGNTKQREVKL